MRKNTEDVFKAWRGGRSYRARGTRGSPIWTDGVRIVSYNTEIARQNGTEVALNAEKYSVTTSTQQANLQTLFRQAGLTFRIYYTQADYQQAINA